MSSSGVPNHSESTILRPCIRTLFVAYPEREVVDDVEETKALVEYEHNLVPVFRHSDCASCVSKALRKVFFDEVQILSPRVKPKIWPLVAPFFDFDVLCFQRQVHIARHKLHSHSFPDLFPAPLQLFHEVADQFCRVFFTDVCGLTFEGASHTIQDRYLCVLKSENGGWLLLLILIPVRSEIIQDHVRVACFGPQRLSYYFPNFKRPYLDYAVASSP